MGLSAAEKREEVKNQLQKLRKDLKVIHAGVTEQQTMPDPVEVKTVMSKLEGLLEILDPKLAKKNKK